MTTKKEQKAGNVEEIVASGSVAQWSVLIGTYRGDQLTDWRGWYTENANRAFRYGRITPKNLEPEPKNSILANFFHQIRLADELGSGVRNLYKYVRRVGPDKGGHWEVIG